MSLTEGVPGDGVDVGQIDLDVLQAAAFPADLGSEYRVVIDAAAYTTIRDHAVVDTSVELGGVLAGRLMKDGDGPYLLVKNAVRGVATKRTGSQVTFTHETWAQIHRDMEHDHPDLQIVGWYHTHPGFGVFLSEMDEFIQEHFFNLPHQVAFVFDPLGDENGLFVWREGRSVRLRRYWLAGRVHYDLESAAVSALDPEPRKLEPPVAPAEEHIRQPQPLGPAPARGTVMWIVGAALALMAAFWVGATATRVGGAHRQEQARALESLIRTGLFRDDLGRQLDDLGRELGRVQMVLQKARAWPGASQDDLHRDSLGEARDLLAAAHKRLAGISQTFTQADRLARRMGQVAGLSDELRAISGELQAQRLIVATLCQSQADLLERDGEAEELKMARELRMLAARLFPTTSVAGSGVFRFSPAPVPAEKSRNLRP